MAGVLPTVRPITNYDSEQDTLKIVLVFFPPIGVIVPVPVSVFGVTVVPTMVLPPMHRN